MKSSLLTLTLSTLFLTSASALTPSVQETKEAINEDIAKLEKDIQKAEQVRKGNVANLSKEVGHDPVNAGLLNSANQDAEKLTEKDLPAVEALGKKIESRLDKADQDLTTAETRKVKAPTEFPMACGNPKITSKLKIYAGALEHGTGRALVFIRGKEGAHEGVERIMLDEKVGLYGSNAADNVISQTSQDRYVEAYVDPNSKKVMCVSKEIPVSQYDANKAKYEK